MRFRVRFACSWLLVLAAAPLGAQEGKLDQVSDAVRDGNDHHDEDPHPHDDLDDWLWGDDDEESSFDHAFGRVFAWTVEMPFLVPRTMLGDGGGPAFFSAFPTREGYWHALDVAEERGADRSWSVRPRIEYGGGFDRLERTGLGLQLEHASRFGLDATWNHWHEDLSSGGSDSLDLGDANLVYRFAQGSHGAFRAGLGLNWLSDERGEEFGFDSTYGIDFLTPSPIAGAIEFDLGTLGEATLQHARFELGAVFRRVNLFTSYDWFDIDGVELRSWGVGVRAWL